MTIQTLLDIQEPTDRIEFTWSNHTLVHHAFLQRISLDNPDYVELVRGRDDLTRKLRRIEQKEAFLHQQEWIEAELGQPWKIYNPDGSEETRKPTMAEIEERAADLDEYVTKFQADADKWRAELITTNATRLAYLTKDWGSTEPESGPPIECNAENVLKYYPPALIDLALETVERAVFGPFTQTQEDTTS